MVVFPYERVDGQQLREGMTDELKGTIDNLQTRLPMRQNNFGSSRVRCITDLHDIIDSICVSWS